jgi:hypothetical protein
MKKKLILIALLSSFCAKHHINRHQEKGNTCGETDVPVTQLTKNSGKKFKI